MRDRIIGALGDLTYRRFLVYLMGPYKAFDADWAHHASGSNESADLSQIPEQADYGTLVGSNADHDGHEAVLDLLRFVRDRLRAESGVNAFLAIDIGIPLDEMDAGTQSIEFALASNAIVYVIPMIGANLGVGIEVGSVLETIYRERTSDAEGDPVTRHHHRVLFVHESGIRSAMIAAVRDRWDARVYAYTDRDDLVRQVRLFVRDIVRREHHGELPRLDDVDA